MSPPSPDRRLNLTSEPAFPSTCQQPGSSSSQDTAGVTDTKGNKFEDFHHIPELILQPTIVGAIVADVQLLYNGGQLLGPKGIAVNSARNLIVVDNKTPCVYVFQLNGKLGSRATPLNYLTWMAISSSAAEGNGQFNGVQQGLLQRRHRC